jgi:hypothetical protein
MAGEPDNAIDEPIDPPVPLDGASQAIAEA